MEQVGIEIGNGRDNTIVEFIDNRKNIILNEENIGLKVFFYISQ